jgi:hypothetical protein
MCVCMYVFVLHFALATLHGSRALEIAGVWLADSLLSLCV